MELRPSLHLGVVAIEKAAFGSPSSKVTDFTFTINISPLVKQPHNSIGNFAQPGKIGEMQTG